VCGFLGVMAVWGFRRGGLLGNLVRRQMLMWAAFILVWGLLMPRIDNAAHIGGFLGGALLAFRIAPKGLRSESALRRRFWSVAAAAAVLVVLASSAWAAVAHFEEKRASNQRIRIAGLLDAATRDLGRSYFDEKEPPGKEWFTAQARGLEASADRLVEKSPPRDDRDEVVVREVASAIRLRAEQLRARVEGLPPPAGNAIVDANRAIAAWLASFRR
jgi:hypothetical protein